MIQEVWDVLVTLAPPLLLGAAIAGAIHVLLPPNFITRHLRGRGGVLKAVAFGVPMPLCSCGVLPTALGLKRDGASDGASVGFLISTPQTGIDSILVSAGFLGWPFALFKVVSAAVMGVAGGVLTDLSGRQVAEVEPQAPSCAVAGTRSLRGALDHGVDLLRMIWRWLVVGILISAAIGVWVPDSWLQGLGSLGGLGAGLAALAVSLPLYVCATASVPVAAALVAGGMPLGAALVFLMAGPATNAATVGSVYRAFGGRILAIYLTTIIVGSMGLGLAFDFLLGGAANSHAVHDHSPGTWQLILAAALLGLLIWFAIEDVRRWIRGRGTGTMRARDRIEVAVTGMSCNGCVRHLEDVLLASDEIEFAEVTLEPQKVLVSGSADRAEIRRLIGEAGYEAV